MLFYVLCQALWKPARPPTQCPGWSRPCGHVNTPIQNQDGATEGRTLVGPSFVQDPGPPVAAEAFGRNWCKPVWFHLLALGLVVGRNVLLDILGLVVLVVGLGVGVVLWALLLLVVIFLFGSC